MKKYKMVNGRFENVRHKSHVGLVLTILATLVVAALIYVNVQEGGMNKPETLYRTKTIQVGNATVCIHQPILTEKEREKVAESIISALSRYGKAIIKN